MKSSPGEGQDIHGGLLDLEVLSTDGVPGGSVSQGTGTAEEL